MMVMSQNDHNDRKVQSVKRRFIVKYKFIQLILIHNQIFLNH